MYSRTSGLHAPWGIPLPIGVCAECDRTELSLRKASLAPLRWPYSPNCDLDRPRRVGVSTRVPCRHRARLTARGIGWIYAAGMATTDGTPGAVGSAESGRIAVRTCRGLDLRRRGSAGCPRARGRHRRRRGDTRGRSTARACWPSSVAAKPSSRWARVPESAACGCCRE